MKARVILKLRDGSDFSYDDCYEYDDLEKAANDIADEILKKEYVMSWDPFGVSIIPARDIKSIRIDKGFKTISPPPSKKRKCILCALSGGSKTFQRKYRMRVGVGYKNARAVMLWQRKQWVCAGYMSERGISEI